MGDPHQTRSVCYVVPSFTPDESEHFAHLPRFLSELATLCDVHVIVQRGGTDDRNIAGVRSLHVQRGGNHFARALGLLGLAGRIRREGCRRFFVRISASAAFLLGMASRVLGIQLYYWVSGQGRDMKPGWSLREIGHRVRWEINDRLLRTNIRLAHRFVTGPASMAGYFAREYGVDPEKIIVLFNDVDTEVFTPSDEPKELVRKRLGLPEDRPIVLFVGRISRLKGGRYLVPIAQSLKERLPTAFLLAVGAVHLPEEVRRAGTEGLDNLRFAGAQPNRSLPSYYQAADVLIMPSESEGFPRVLLEAMACGLAVAAFDVGGIREIVALEQHQSLVPRGDISALVDRVAELLSDRDLRASQGRAARRRVVAQFSTAPVARMFYEKIVLA